MDAANDLALLKAEGKNLTLPVVSSRTIRLGSKVATVGLPRIRKPHAKRREAAKEGRRLQAGSRKTAEKGKRFGGTSSGLCSPPKSIPIEPEELLRAGAHSPASDPILFNRPNTFRLAVRSRPRDDRAGRFESYPPLFLKAREPHHLPERLP